MIYIVTIIVCILILIFLRIVLGYDLKQIKLLAKNEKLDKIVSKFPDNITIVKAILKMLGNESVKIEEDKESKTCLYLVQGNKIIVANVSDTFSRVQTMAHECLHSIQNKKTLWAQYIISNIYLLYFAVISAITIFKVIKNPIIFLVILSVLGLIQYILKSYLETDAMIKARFLAKDYLEKNSIGTKEEREMLIKEYDKINLLGIPATNYSLIRNVILKVIIYSIISLTILKI